MTPGPDGGLYLLVPGDGGSVIALLDTTGKPQPGWPIGLEDRFCSSMAAVADGSIRVVCALNPGPVSAAFAFTPDGRSIAGWPVEIPAAVAARVVDGDLQMLAYVTDANGVIGGLQLAVVEPDGTLRMGRTIGTPDTNLQDWVPQIGPDGTGYVIAYPNSTTGETQITAFDMDGVRAGWLVEVKGRPSGLAFGRGGRIYVTEPQGAGSRILPFNGEGRPLPVRSDALPVMATSAYRGAGPFDGAPPPVVAEDETVFLVTEHQGTTVFSLDGVGAVLAGWPYHDLIGLQWSYSPPGDTGGSSYRLDPAVGPGNVLHLLNPPREATVGGTVVAIGPDGTVRPGWPVGLKRPGAEFWSVVVGPDGTAYVLAVEPERGDTSSASLLAIAPDSTVRYTISIIEP